MNVFNIKRYPNYINKHFELKKNYNSVIIIEKQNNKFYICFDNICVKPNTYYTIYLNSINNVYYKKLLLEIKGKNNQVLLKKIINGKTNNYFTFYSGDNCYINIYLYTIWCGPNKFIKFFDFIIFDKGGNNCIENNNCFKSNNCEPTCDVTKYDEPLNIIKSYDVNLNNKFSEIYNIYNDYDISYNPANSTYFDRSNESLIFYSYKYNTFSIEPDLSNVIIEENRCYYINLIAFFNTPCVDMKFKILDENNNIIAEKIINGFIKTTFKLVNRKFTGLKIIFTNEKEINNKKLIIYWLNILRVNTCEEMNELNEENILSDISLEIEDDESIVIPNPIYYYSVFDCSLNTLSVVDSYSHYSEYSKTLEVINNYCKNGKILSKVVPKDILVDGSGSYLVKVGYGNNYNPDINCYLYQNNIKIGPSDSLVDISDNITQYYLFNLETSDNILICLYFTKKYNLSANIKELSILQLNNLDGSITKLDFPISYLDQSGNATEEWTSIPTGFPTICDLEDNKIKINNYCKLNGNCEPEVYVGNGFKSNCSENKCGKIENNCCEKEDNYHVKYKSLSKYNALMEKHRIEDKINSMKEYIINTNCFNVRNDCKIDKLKFNCKEVNEFVCYFNDNKNINNYYCYLSELEILEQTFISLQNTIKELYKINKNNKNIIVQCSNNLISDIDRTNNQELINKNIGLMKDINRTFIYKSEEVLTLLTDTIIEYKYEYPKCGKIFVEYLVVYANNIEIIVYNGKLINVLTLEETLNSIDIVDDASKHLQKEINMYNSDNIKLCYLINFIKQKIEYIKSKCDELIELSRERVSNLIFSLERKIEFLDLKVKYP
jgi:hypothetical protein